ncbi:MAG: ABC transporter permease [Candidatus Bathyarchaeia archaeon]
MIFAEKTSPSLLRSLWALTARELKKWLNDPVMVIMFVLQPLIWMGLLGKSININALFSPSNISNMPASIPVPGKYLVPPSQEIIYINGTLFQQLLSSIGSGIMEGAFGVVDYFSYMAVGIISMVVVMTSTFSGVSIVWDRRLGFLDKVLSTPAPRAAIVFAKILNAFLRAAFQATVILALAYVLGLQLSPSFTLINILGIYTVIFLVSVGLSSIFLAFSMRTTRIERPMQFINLIMLPLMFTSNAFFPVNLMPGWLQLIVRVNPLTYLTDALRQLTIVQLNPINLALDFIYLATFATALTVLGMILSWKYLTT